MDQNHSDLINQLSKLSSISLYHYSNYCLTKEKENDINFITIIVMTILILLLIVIVMIIIKI